MKRKLFKTSDQKQMEELLSDIYYKVNGFLEPEKWGENKGLFIAEVDLFRPGMKFWVHFKYNDEGRIRIEKLENALVEPAKDKKDFMEWF